MSRRIFLFLFLIVCTALLSLPASHKAVAEIGDEEFPQRSLTITYLQYGMNENEEKTHRWFRLEGTAQGYEELPELFLYVNDNDEWRPDVSFYTVNCPAPAEEGSTLMCWETSQIFEPIYSSTQFDFVVEEPINGVTATASIEFGCASPNCIHPNQCSGVCGV